MAAELPPDLNLELQSVIDRYVAAVQQQREAMLGAEMEVDIDGRFPKLEESGTMRVLRTISKVGEITFKVLGEFKGDDRVRKELIVRYLTEEQEKKGFGALPITPRDYDFQIKAILTDHANTPDAHRIYVFDVIPWRNAEGVFRGELWLDGETAMPLRESGELVRNPHMIISKFRFVRDYELKNGFAVIKRMEGRVDVRFYGSAELDINFSNVTWPTEQARLDSGL